MVAGLFIANTMAAFPNVTHGVSLARDFIHMIANTHHDTKGHDERAFVEIIGKAHLGTRVCSACSILIHHFIIAITGSLYSKMNFYIEMMCNKLRHGADKKH